MRKLERLYGDRVTVIGVSSPKYPAEGQPENLRAAVERLAIEHPVVNDPEYAVWDAYAVKAWPTLVYISAAGEVVGFHQGEAPFESLEEAVRELMAGGEAVVPTVLPSASKPAERPPGTLAFPGKVLAAGNRLYIADSGHHRVVVTDLEGAVDVVVGSGIEGYLDGPAGVAQFNSPQGLAVNEAGGVLFVADSRNHVIRAVDLGSGAVTTMAGTGRQALRRSPAGPAQTVDLSSPWDVALHRDDLYITMAGLHQIWRFQPSAGTVSLWAGTGHEAIRDGPRQQAWFAQPMGLALDNGALYVSCPESQGVRKIDLMTGSVVTLVGGGLFSFGDTTGPGPEALLQHNQGLAAGGGLVYIVDTYNHRIKLFEESSQQVRAWAGSGIRGHLDGPNPGARFFEPGGASLGKGALYVADTNNHCIRRIDLETETVQTLGISGLEGSFGRKLSPGSV